MFFCKHYTLGPKMSTFFINIDISTSYASLNRLKCLLGAILYLYLLDYFATFSPNPDPIWNNIAIYIPTVFPLQKRCLALDISGDLHLWTVLESSKLNRPSMCCLLKWRADEILDHVNQWLSASAWGNRFQSCFLSCLPTKYTQDLTDIYTQLTHGRAAFASSRIYAHFFCGRLSQW
jgi:hypothetical protein